MLKKEDRIFTNLYGFAGVDLASSQKRGDWDNTKNLLLLGQDPIIDQIKKMPVKQSTPPRGNAMPAKATEKKLVGTTGIKSNKLTSAGKTAVVKK